MRLFDTHCHLQDPAFAGEFDATVERARAAGLIGILLCGYDPSSNRHTLELAARSPLILPAVGIHPHDAAKVDQDALGELARQAALPAVAAVGEIGLDFYRDLSPPEAQYAALDAQLEIAIAARKPVSVHSRSAESDILVPLAAYARRSPLGADGRAGIMHCFGGTLEQARPFVELGFAISIACSITYPRNEEARRIAAHLPLESLVVETDSPYLPPQALRGKRNEPATVSAAVEAIAAARGLTPDEVAAATTANAERLLRVPSAPGVR